MSTSPSLSGFTIYKRHRLDLSVLSPDDAAREVTENPPVWHFARVPCLNTTKPMFGCAYGGDCNHPIGFSIHVTPTQVWILVLLQEPQTRMQRWYIGAARLLRKIKG